MSTCGGTCNIELICLENDCSLLDSFVNKTIEQKPEYRWLRKYYDFDRHIILCEDGEMYYNAIFIEMPDFFASLKSLLPDIEIKGLWKVDWLVTSGMDEITVSSKKGDPNVNYVKKSFEDEEQKDREWEKIQQYGLKKRKKIEEKLLSDISQLTNGILIPCSIETDLNGKKICINFDIALQMRTVIENIICFTRDEKPGYDLEDYTKYHKRLINKSEIKRISFETTRERIIQFVKLCILFRNEEILAKIAGKAVKKKDGSLLLNRIIQICYVDICNGDGYCYFLCAKNLDSETISVEIRFEYSQKYNLESIYKVADCLDSDYIL